MRFNKSAVPIAWAWDLTTKLSAEMHSLCLSVYQQHCSNPLGWCWFGDLKSWSFSCVRGLLNTKSSSGKSNNRCVSAEVLLMLPAPQALGLFPLLPIYSNSLQWTELLVQMHVHQEQQSGNSECTNFRTWLYQEPKTDKAHKRPSTTSLGIQGVKCFCASYQHRTGHQSQDKSKRQCLCQQLSV